MDIILYNIFVPICCLIIGYIFGDFQTSIVIGKIFFHQDPRDFGSHNAGGTNAGRLWGKKIGFVVIVIDMFKAFAPIWICWAIATYANFPYANSVAHPLIDKGAYSSGYSNYFAISYPVYWFAALGCFVGHCWPISARFKGGKGVSCFFGTAVGTSWGLGFFPALIYFAFLKWKKYVSLASMLTSMFLSLLAWIWAILRLNGIIPIQYSCILMYGNSLNPDWFYAVIVSAMTLIMIVRHRTNIIRIKNGTERKIQWMK